MSKRKAVSPKLRREAIARDGGKCLKCRRRSRLEVHHIVPVYEDGPDAIDNLITLCKPCHDEAPDDPVDFIHWVVKTGLPPEMDSSKELTKMCLLILFHREGLSGKTGEAFEIVDEIYSDLWKIRRTVVEAGGTESDSLGDGLGLFFQKYYPEEHRKQQEERARFEAQSLKSREQDVAQSDSSPGGKDRELG